MNQDSAPERRFADEAFQQSLQDLEILLETPENSQPAQKKGAIAQTLTGQFASEDAVWEEVGEDLEGLLDAIADEEG